jgi:DNA-binding transcriptional ArsR family regulator
MTCRWDKIAVDHAEGLPMEKLNDPALEHVAAFFRAMSVPLRLKILNALRAGERNVGQITTDLACSQANASKHLAVLAGSGLIEKRQSGTSTFYRIRDPRIYKLCDLVCGHVGERLGRDIALHGIFAQVAPAPRRPARKLPAVKRART